MLPTTGDGRYDSLLERILGAPISLRAQDLLPPDQPRPLHVQGVGDWRFNGFVRLLAFAAILISGGIATVFGLVVVMNSLGKPAGQSQLLGSPWLRVGATIGVVLAYWVLGRFVELRRPLFELAGSRALRGLVSGIGLGVCLMAACAGLLGVFGVFRIEGFNPGYSPWVALLEVGIVASVSEEILFRGILFRLVEGSFGTWIALTVSAMAFGAAHLRNPQATLVGAFGIALEAGILFAALYVFTRSLWTVIGLHFAWNVVQGPVLGLVISGNPGTAHGFVRSELVGEQWLSGGQFGIEASVVTIVLLTALGVWLLVVVAKQDLIVQPFWLRRRRLSKH